jgi:hypothetical protein
MGLHCVYSFCFFLSYSLQRHRLTVCSVLYDIIKADTKKRLNRKRWRKKRGKNHRCMAMQRIFLYNEWLIDIGPKKSNKNIDVFFLLFHGMSMYCSDNWATYRLCIDSIERKNTCWIWDEVTKNILFVTVDTDLLY